MNDARRGRWQAHRTLDELADSITSATTTTPSEHAIAHYVTPEDDHSGHGDACHRTQTGDDTLRTRSQVVGYSQPELLTNSDTPHPGSVCWIDVSSTDPAGSRDFYAGLFGWTYQIDPDPGRGHYTTALLKGRPVAGLGGVPVPAGQPVTWTPYLTSANMTHTAAVFDLWGGRVLYGPADVPGRGRLLIGADPTAGVIGFWQPATPWIFHTADPGALFWAELNTWKGAWADEFFANLFGYRQRQIGDGIEIDYTTWSRGEQTMLGRLELDESWAAPDTSTHWMLHFAVDPQTGTDAAVNQVLQLGGRVDIGPYDTDLGRMARVADPSGAAFALIDPTARLAPAMTLQEQRDEKSRSVDMSQDEHKAAIARILDDHYPLVPYGVAYSWLDASAVGRIVDDLHGGLVDADPCDSATLPITIYLSDESVHEQVEAAVEDLLAAAGGHIEHRDDPVLGSWFRRMWARTGQAVHSPLAREAAILAAHAAESRLVHAQDATVTATMLQNLGPVLAAVQPTKEAVIRAGALLIVKMDSTLVVHQLTPAQQLHLDHQPQLAQSPYDILSSLELRLGSSAQSADGVDSTYGSTTVPSPLNSNPASLRITSNNEGSTPLHAADHQVFPEAGAGSWF